MSMKTETNDPRKERDSADEPARGEGAVTGMVERSREPHENSTPASPIARERAMASERLEAIAGPSLRSPDVEHAPGLRYADKPTE